MSSATSAIATGVTAAPGAIVTAVTEAPSAVVAAAKATAEAVPSITDIQPPSLPTEVKAPTFPGMPDISVNPMDAVDFILGLLSKKPAAQMTSVNESYPATPSTENPVQSVAFPTSIIKSTGMVKAAAGIIVGLTILGTMLMDSSKKRRG